MKAEDFKEELKIIREAGFNPIAVGLRANSEYKAFLFLTDIESDQAFGALDIWASYGDKSIDGLWYGQDDEEHNEVDWLYL